MIEANHLYTILSEYLSLHHCRARGRILKDRHLKGIHVFTSQKSDLKALTVEVQMLGFITSMDNTFARQVVAVEFEG